jgi:SNF2 family DNA or RNA helicase
MWFEISKLPRIYNPVQSINKMIFDNSDKLRYMNNNMSYHTNDPIINIIIHYYFHSLKNKEQLIKIDDHNIVFINTKLVDKYKYEPIFNAICSLYVRNIVNSNVDIPNIELLSIPSSCEIDNKIFTKQKNNNFNVKLFDYQKKSIMRMIEIENNKNMEFERTFHININNNSIYWDPHIDSIVDTKQFTKVTSRGGILSDMMGLGKTITAIGLMHYGKTLEEHEMVSPKIYSQATLVIVPSHLAKQWVDEYIKAHKTSKKIVVILTKTHHDKTTYKEIAEADIVIITIQFLLNIKNYCSINFGDIRSPSSINIEHRYSIIEKYFYKMIEDESYIYNNRPLFEYFSFNRVIIDEGHEIMEQHNITMNAANFIEHFISNIECKYKWYISGTPFTTFKGLKNVLKYLNVMYQINDESIKILHNYRILNSFEINVDNNNIECDNLYNYMSYNVMLERFFKTIMVRHLKDDVQDNVKLPGYKEHIEWVELTKSERSIYDSKFPNKNRLSESERRILQQICCHPLIAESYKKIIGGDTVSLENVQDKLIEHHTKVVEEYTKKIDALDKKNQAYHMLLSNYRTKLTESKYVLDTLQKINNNIDFNENENCIICYDTMNETTMTPCGHMFCKSCIQLCLNHKKECPMCKHVIEPSSLVEIKKKKEVVEEPIDNSLVNPLIIKYGAKLGKLIQTTRTLLSQDARIIIFSQWDEMLLLISKSMLENGIDSSFITGNVYKRNKAITRFKMGGEDNGVILLSLEKSASGTNLTEATHIIIVEPIDAEKESIKAIEAQAIGRAVRLGQKQEIQVIRILCKDTIEEEIYKTKYIE